MYEKLQHSIQTLISAPVLRWAFAFAVIYYLSHSVAFFRRRKIQPGVFRWNQAITEIVLITIGGAFTGFFFGAFNGWMKDLGLVVHAATPAPWYVIFAEFAAFFVLFDTWFYWNHRLMHIEPIYTLVHRWHHLSMTPTVVSTTNVNPLESLINGGFATMYVAAAYSLGFPIHDQTMPFILASTIGIGVWIHSGFEFMPRWLNKYWATKWIITATFHDQHHQYYRMNYGGFTTVWDRLCGTMRPKYEQEFANPRSFKLEERRQAAKLAEKQAAAAAPAEADAEAVAA